MSKVLRMSNEVSKGLKFISTTELIYGSKKKTYLSLSRTEIGKKTEIGGHIYLLQFIG